MCACVGDNWTLQEVAETVTAGLSPAFGEQFVFDRESKDHVLRDVPRAVMQLQALWNFLSSVVLQDAIHVDAEFVGAWSGLSPQLDWLRAERIITPSPVLKYPDTAARPARPDPTL